MQLDGQASIATLSLLAATSVVLAGTTAAGGQSGASARLAYARSGAASSCPDESALRSAVAARVGYDPFFPWAKRTFVVQVWRDRGRYMARLQIIDEHGLSHGVRELSSNGQDCTELFDTAALAISIAMDQLPKDDSLPVTGSIPAPPQPDTDSTNASPPASSAIAAPPPVSPEPLPPAPPGDHAHIALGVDILGSISTAPAPAAGVSLFLGPRWRSASASLELRADAPASAQSAAGAGRVTASSYTAALVPCAHRGDVFLCGVGVLGLLHGESSGIAVPRSPPPTAVVAAGGRLGLEWPLSPKISLRARFDLVVDLRRATFLVDGQEAWRAPILAGTVGAGIFASLE